MITQEEKQEIIDKAVEKTLLLIPEVIGNMMTQHMALNKINKKFYADHPEFKDHKDAVQSVVEMIEGKDPLSKYEDILKAAVPEIRKRIKTVGKVDMKTISANPNREYKQIEPPEAPSDKGINPNGII